MPRSDPRSEAAPGESKPGASGGISLEREGPRGATASDEVPDMTDGDMSGGTRLLSAEKHAQAHTVRNSLDWQ